MKTQNNTACAGTPISADDFAFLSRLQKDMLEEQVKHGDSNPVYYGLVRTTYVPTTEDHSDGFIIRETDGEEEITVIKRREDIPYAIQSVIEAVFPEREMPADTKWKINGDANDIVLHRKICKREETYRFLCDNAEDILDAIEQIEKISDLEPFIELECENITCRNELMQEHLFLTEKDAKSCLGEYKYAWPEGTHPLAMTAQTSQDIKRLWDIIKNTDWDSLKTRTSD